MQLSSGQQRAALDFSEKVRNGVRLPVLQVPLNCAIIRVQLQSFRPQVPPLVITPFTIIIFLFR